MAEVAVDERRLLKTMRWYDGVVIGMANPGFLLVGLAFSILAMGGIWAAVVWIISAVIGALQAYVYAEPAAMFPDKPGGLSVYAREGWRKYFSLAGPIAVFGYWFAWSSVLAIYGHLRRAVCSSRSSAARATSPPTSFDAPVVTPAITWPVLIGVMCILLCYLFNIRGMRPAVWFSYVVGALMILPVGAIAIGAFLTGDFSNHQINSNFLAETPPVYGDQRQRVPPVRARHGLALHHRVVDVRARSRRDVRPRVQGHEERHAQGARGDGRHQRRARDACCRSPCSGRSATTPSSPTRTASRTS